MGSPSWSLLLFLFLLLFLLLTLIPLLVIVILTLPYIIIVIIFRSHAASLSGRQAPDQNTSDGTEIAAGDWVGEMRTQPPQRNPEGCTSFDEWMKRSHQK
jgi:hypothetical protein